MTISRWEQIDRRRLVLSSVVASAAALTSNSQSLARQSPLQPATLRAQDGFLDDSSDVYMFRGNPARTGQMPGHGPDPSNGVAVLWQFMANKAFVASPVIVDGVLYVGGSGQEAYLYAVNAEDGSERWRFQKSDEWEWFSTPAVVDGVVYVGSGDNGNIYAVNAEDGSERWRFPVGSGLSSPAVVDGVVYIGSTDGGIIAVNADDGSERWQFRTGGTQNVGSPAVVDGVVYVAGGDNNLRALNAENGTERWQYWIGSGARTPAVVDGAVYIGEYGAFYAVNAEDGTDRWHFSTDSNNDGNPLFSFPAVVDGTVYTTANGNIFALDVNDGAERWRFTRYYGVAGVDTITGNGMSDPAVADGVVYVAHNDGNVYAVSAQDGSERWECTVKSSGLDTTAPSVVVSGGVVFTAIDMPGILVAIGGQS